MRNNPKTAQQAEIAQTIHLLDVKLHQSKSEEEHAELEKKLAQALEDMLRQVAAKAE